VGHDPLVSINIPCYRQLDELRTCVGAILAQSFEDFEVTLLDDGESEEYRRWVDSIGDARVRYQRNPVRLGAMRNMFSAVLAGRGKYSLAFHEDDVIGRHYLAAAVKILESHPRCGFVACELHEFQENPPLEDPTRPDGLPMHAMFASGADFLRAIFRGVEPMFGSVLYCRDAVKNVRPAHEEFATLVDRPFLLSILERWSGAIIQEPLVWYRKHDYGDDRHLAMCADHVLHLFRTYRMTLPEPLGSGDAELFYRYSGYWLPALFELVPPEGRPSFRRFMFRALRQRLYDPRWSRRYGRKRLLKALVVNAAAGAR
jgi:glycosyltransferase involved in cell wall biosynthesis